MIIRDTLKELLVSEDVDFDLYEAMSPLIDTPEDWDEFDEASNLISVKHFSEFILIPHLAASLIAEDLGIDLTEAIEVLDTSYEYGSLVNANSNANSDEKVNILVTPSKPNPSEPPRHRKISLIVCPFNFCRFSVQFTENSVSCRRVKQLRWMITHQ